MAWMPKRSSQSGSVRTRWSFSGVLGFSSKSITRPELSIRMMPHARLGLAHGKGGDGRLGLGFEMMLDHLLEVHPIELIAREDEDEVVAVLGKIRDVAAHGVGRALIPALVLHRLLGGEHFDEAAAERVKLVSVGDMPVQADGVELRQHEDPAETGVDAVGDRDVDQSIFTGDRYGGLTARLGQWKQARSSAAAEDQADDFGH